MDDMEIEFIVMSVLSVIVLLPIGLALLIVRSEKTRKTLLGAMIGAIPSLIGGVVLGYWLIPLDLSAGPHGPFWAGKLVGEIVGGAVAATIGAIVGASIFLKRSG